MRLPYEWIVGLRYLRSRDRRRSFSLNTLISIGGVMVGVAALIATLAVMTGFKDDLRDKILGTNAHVVVTDRISDGLADYREATRRIESLPHVVAATPLVYRQVMLSSESAAQGVVLRGVDPEREARVTDLSKNMAQGRLEDLIRTSPEVEPKASNTVGKKSRPGIILGKELAARLGVTVGDPVQVLSPVGSEMGPFGITPKIRPFRVVGIFDAGMFEYDTSLAYVSLSAAQDFFRLGDRVSAIEVKVDDIFRAAEVAAQIERTLGFPYAARDWMEMNRNLFSALKLEKAMMFIILVLIILVASFNIVSTLTMTVVEKNREIAILKAMGARPSGVRRIFMVDGLVIGLIGTSLGVPLGLLVCQVLSTFYTLPGDVYYLSHFPFKVRVQDVLLVALSALGISFFATVYPSWRAARLRPAEALRYE